MVQLLTNRSQMEMDLDSGVLQIRTCPSTGNHDANEFAGELWSVVQYPGRDYQRVAGPFKSYHAAKSWANNWYYI